MVGGFNTHIGDIWVLVRLFMRLYGVIGLGFLRKGQSIIHEGMPDSS